MSPYPKKVETFLREVYKKHPEMRRHPDYRIFYLYNDYPEIHESIIMMTNYDIPMDNMFEYIKTMANLLGFELLAMRWNIFDSEIRKKLETEFQDRRGSEYRLLFYEIW
jgi:hypothetical protein